MFLDIWLPKIEKNIFRRLEIIIALGNTDSISFVWSHKDELFYVHNVIVWYTTACSLK